MVGSVGLVGTAATPSLPIPENCRHCTHAGVAAEFRAPPAPPKLCTLQPALPLASSALPLLSAQGFTETYIKTAATASDASSSALGPQLSQLPASSVLDVSVRTGASSFASFKYSGSDSSSSSGGTAVVFSSYLQVFRRHRVLGLVLTVVQAWSAKCSVKHCAYFSYIYLVSVLLLQVDWTGIYTVRVQAALPPSSSGSVGSLVMSGGAVLFIGGQRVNISGAGNGAFQVANPGGGSWVGVV